MEGAVCLLLSTLHLGLRPSLSLGLALVLVAARLLLLGTVVVVVAEPVRVWALLLRAAREA